MTKAHTAKKQKVARIRKATRTVHREIRRHYWERMPEKRRHRIYIWAAFLGISTIVAFQMAYPLDRGLPLANVAGQPVMLASYSDMAKVVSEKFDATKVQLVLGEKTAEFPIKELGAEPNTDKMVAQLGEYPFWQRFIPGSILWQPVQIVRADIYYSDKKLQEFAQREAKAFTKPASNARLTIKDGALKAENEAAGSEVYPDRLRALVGMTDMKMGNVTTVSVPYKPLEPQFTSKDFADVRSQAEQALDHTVTIRAEGKAFSPDRKEIASWLVLGGDENGRPTLSVDKEKIKGFLQSINEKVGTPAGQTNITIVNGRETGRTPGATGRAINVDTLSDELSTAILAPTTAITLNAQFVDVQPSVIFNSKYTTTQEGLQAYVQDVAASRNMHIVIQQLDGEKWYAHARETESIPSASTFKLYLAKILFDKIDAGEIRWSDPMLDTTVAGCFERMTVASTNPCAESWIAQWGRGYINDYIYRLGFSTGTSFTTGGAVQTTAADLNRYMIELNNGTILSGANRERLLDSLGRHPYRYGIPTGSAGIVHDKVGFLWDYVHDTAIVQHPRGTYVMTVMSKGQSYGAIANVTREVERIMYP
ncbi:peptidoglycan binding domain-containing protein [Streptomyces caniscabiei]|uniref:serine hydrolase n=1 Tax=Streptomyces caniscabiei TaxID=2746961 RepID=UPI0029AD55B2|nr:serine hydrolase [Streptomyces caniscabiei]MDX2776315.1 peptidoglycan binding domain-containing protein [Streptomyces caniscabiei]